MPNTVFGKFNVHHSSSPFHSQVSEVGDRGGHTPIICTRLISKLPSLRYWSLFYVDSRFFDGDNRVFGRMRENTVVMARRRRRRRLGGHTTAVGSGGRCAPVSTCISSHTHTARSLVCPLLTLSSARPFSNGIFRSRGAPASPPPASASLTRARRMDGFCNQNADQLGYLAGPSRLTVFVGVVECASASPYIYSTHRFPDERTPLEATGAGKRAKTLSLQYSVFSNM